MNPLDFFSYIQLGILILGIFSVIIAGVQDKKHRLAPAIYLSPTLIGFGLNPILGLIGLITTITTLFFWKEQWNKTFGLADALLFLILFITLANPNTATLAFAICLGAAIEIIVRFLLLKQKTDFPLVWIYTKWLIIAIMLTSITTLLLR